MITFRLSNLQKDKMTGAVNDENLASWVKVNGRYVDEIEADGYELMHCCNLLGRQMPPRKSWVFVGTNAQELARNWEAE